MQASDKVFEKYIDIIYKTALFKGIERNDILVMLNCLKPRVCSFKANEFIIYEGDAFENVGIVLKGEATVSKENAAGNRVIITIAKQGDIFGEIVAFSSQAAWPATVQAQQNTEILFMPKAKIIGECARMCPWHRMLIQNFLRIVSMRALMLNKKVEYLTIRSMRGKISTYLLDQYKVTGNININLPLNRNELSDFLNVSRPSMSRELCKMRDEGIIDFHLNSFRILDIEALKAMSMV